MTANLVPLPYRRVSVRRTGGALTEAAIRELLLGHEAYRRTDFVAVASERGDAWAVAAVTREDDEALFSRVTAVDVLALPETTRFAHAPATDCANPSALAALADARGLGRDATLVVQGLYDHVNFIHRPDPIRLRVVEVAPPEPPKLFDLVQRVLAYADLPPILVELERIDVLALAAAQPRAAEYLVPCRSGGLDRLGGRLHFLDERPAKREAWTLIGCERSLQFHRHYYGDEPPRVEMCPRRLAGERAELTMLKCCLLEQHVERAGNVITVPWGSDLATVEQALRRYVVEASRAGAGYSWDGILLVDELLRRRSKRPRTDGLTMVIDTGIGFAETADILESAGAHVDLWKLSFGTSVFIPRDVLERKLALIEEHGVDTMPGGTLFEAAIVQQNCNVYMRRAAELGFTAVEISDGTIALPAFRRRLAIECARDAGLTPITEVGKKDPAQQPSAVQLAELALADLEAGATAVIIEGRESGRSVGIYDREGNPDADGIEAIARAMGPAIDRLIWEAPLKPQQAALVARFGVNVGLGNIDPRGVLALEALRVGLRFETLKPIAEQLSRSGELDLAAAEGRKKDER